MYKTLVVEDNAVFRYAVRTIVDWASCGFELAAEAVNGKHALTLLEARRFDLILTDVSMPEMNGIDLLRTVKQQAPDTVIVMLSSYDDFQFVKDSMKIGAEDYLLKHDLEPAAMRQMLEQVKQVLDKQKDGRRAQTDVSSHGVAAEEAPIGMDAAAGTAGSVPASASACRRKEIRQAIAYIQAHYAEDISTAALASSLGFSANYLSNLFRSETGCRIKEFVNRERVEQARRLLKDTNLKVYEVAERVGFQDVSYFCKVFKEITGTTVSTERNS